MHSAEMMPRNSTTSVSRFDAYWLPACCPSFFFTDRYTGRNAVTRMPPTTISYSMFGSPFATWYELDSSVDPSANAMIHVRAKPVMREIITHTLMSAADDPTAAAVSSGSCSGCGARASVRSAPACLLMMGSSEVDPGNAARSARELGAERRAASRGSGVEGSKGSRGGVVRSWPAWRPPMRISEVSPGAAARRRAFALVGSRRGCGLGTTCWATAAAMTVRSSPAWRPPILISDVEPGSAARTCVRWGRRGASAGCSSAGSATRVC